MAYNSSQQLNKKTAWHAIIWSEQGNGTRYVCSWRSLICIQHVRTSFGACSLLAHAHRTTRTSMLRSCPHVVHRKYRSDSTYISSPFCICRRKISAYTTIDAYSRPMPVARYQYSVYISLALFVATCVYVYIKWLQFFKIWMYLHPINV